MEIASKEEMNRTLTKRVKMRHKAGKAFFMNVIVIAIVTLSFSGLDCLVIHNITDLAMMEDEIMGYVMAYGIALILNLIPLICAVFVHHAIYKTARFPWVFVVLLTGAFTALYVTTVILRLAYHDLYGVSGAETLVNAVSSEIGTYAGATDSKRGYAVVLLLCVEPLSTSIVNFIVGYLADNPLRKKKECLEIQIVEEEAQIAFLTAKLETMKRDIMEELRIDEEQMMAAIAECICIGDVLKALAREYLAEYLANPPATSRLSHELDDNDKTLPEEQVTPNCVSPEIEAEVYEFVPSGIGRAEEKMESHDRMKRAVNGNIGKNGTEVMA